MMCAHYRIGNCKNLCDGCSSSFSPNQIGERQKSFFQGHYDYLMNKSLTCGFYSDHLEAYEDGLEAARVSSLNLI